MDYNSRNRLLDLLKKMTHTGELKLDETSIKELKNVCKNSDVAVEVVFTEVFGYLAERHAQIRYSCYQIINELFIRSHLFRVLLLDKFKVFLSLTSGLENEKKWKTLLPKDWAARLKRESLRTVFDWNDKYGSRYKKLQLGFNYLVRANNVDFDKIKEEIELAHEKEIASETQRKIRVRQEFYETVKEIEKRRKEVENHSTVLETCFSLLFKDEKRNTLFTEGPQSEKSSSSAASHGLTTTSYSLDLEVSKDLRVEVTHHNADLLLALRDEGKLSNELYLPLLDHWKHCLEQAKEFEKIEDIVPHLNFVEKMLKSINEFQDRVGYLRVNAAALYDIIDAQNNEESAETFVLQLSSSEEEDEDESNGWFSEDEDTHNDVYDDDAVAPSSSFQSKRSKNDEVSNFHQPLLKTDSKEKREKKSREKEEQRHPQTFTYETQKRIHRENVIKIFKEREALKRKHDAHRRRIYGSSTASTSTDLSLTSQNALDLEFDSNNMNNDRELSQGKKKEKTEFVQLTNKKKRIGYTAPKQLRECGFVMENGRRCHLDIVDKCPTHGPFDDGEINQNADPDKINEVISENEPVLYKPPPEKKTGKRNHHGDEGNWKVLIDKRKKYLEQRKEEERKKSKLIDLKTLDKSSKTSAWKKRIYQKMAKRGEF